MGHQFAGGSSGWCPESEGWTARTGAGLTESISWSSGVKIRQACAQSHRRRLAPEEMSDLRVSSLWLRGSCTSSSSRQRPSAGKGRQPAAAAKLYKPSTERAILQLQQHAVQLYGLAFAAVGQQPKECAAP